MFFLLKTIQQNMILRITKDIILISYVWVLFLSFLAFLQNTRFRLLLIAINMNNYYVRIFS